MRGRHDVDVDLAVRAALRGLVTRAGGVAGLRGDSVEDAQIAQDALKLDPLFHIEIFLAHFFGQLIEAKNSAMSALISSSL